MEMKDWSYEERFRKVVIREVLSGRIGITAAQRKYGIGGNSTITRWIEKYSKLGVNKIKRSPMKKKKPAETPEEKIAELESELFLYKKLIEVSTYFRDPAVKKKIVEGLCAYYGKSVEEIIQMDIPLLRSAKYLALADKDTTNTKPERKKGKNRKTSSSNGSRQSEL